MPSCLWNLSPTCFPFCVSNISLVLSLVLFGATGSQIRGSIQQKTSPAKNHWVVDHFSFLLWIINGLMYIPSKELAESMAGRQEREWDFFQLLSGFTESQTCRSLPSTLTLVVKLFQTVPALLQAQLTAYAFVLKFITSSGGSVKPISVELDYKLGCGSRYITCDTTAELMSCGVTLGASSWRS